MVYTILNTELGNGSNLVVFSDKKRKEAMRWLVSQGVDVSNDALDEYYATDNMFMVNIDGELSVVENETYGLYECDEDGIVEYDIIPFNIESVKDIFNVEDVSERIKENEITLGDNETENRVCRCFKISKFFA